MARLHRHHAASAGRSGKKYLGGHAVATFRRVCAISAGCGTTASSSGGLVGVGVFFAAIRVTGWSRCQKHSSCTVAAISAPYPIRSAASCSTTAREVFFTDRTIVDYRATLTADRDRIKQFNQELLKRGVVKAANKIYVSLAHTEADVDETLGIFDQVLAVLSANP